MTKWPSVLVLPTLLTGCNLVGPASLSNGRAVYNEVINRTADEQVLNMIVRIRYEETFGMLDVASVTANVKVRANASANAGIGPDASFQGNLVPLSAGFAYEENPTISYVPHGGTEYIRGLLSPLPLDTLVLFGRVAHDPGQFFRIVVRQVNGLHNTPGASDDFDRLQYIIDRLRAEVVLDIGIGGEEGEELRLVISNYDPEHTELVAEFTRLLGLSAPPANGEKLVLPVRAAVALRETDALNIEMRSIYEIMRIIGASIEIPEEHLDSGIVRPPAGQVREAPQASRLTIRSSRKRPGNAFVAMQVHGWWFYVDGADPASKAAFATFQGLLGASVRRGTPQAAPLLTVPVG